MGRVQQILHCEAHLQQAAVQQQVTLVLALVHHTETAALQIAAAVVAGVEMAGLMAVAVGYKVQTQAEQHGHQVVAVLHRLAVVELMRITEETAGVAVLVARELDIHQQLHTQAIMQNQGLAYQVETGC